MRRRESVEKQPGETRRARGEKQRHNDDAAYPRGQANSLTNSRRLLARKRAKLFQERLTSCRRQRRPTVTSEARVGRFAQYAFLEKTLRKFQGPRDPSQGGGSALDPRVIRKRLNAKLFNWSTSKPRRYWKFRTGTQQYMFPFLHAQNASTGSYPRSRRSPCGMPLRYRFHDWHTSLASREDFQLAQRAGHPTQGAQWHNVRSGVANQRERGGR